MSDERAVGDTMTDDEVFDRIDDPALIATHEEALEVIDQIDQEIAGIEAQLQHYRVEMQTNTTTELREDWARRATYAAAIKRQQRRRVANRDKELRGIAHAHQVVRDRSEGVAKNVRLQAEAEARRADKASIAAQNQAEAAATAERRSIQRIFANVAREMLPREQFEMLMAEANRRRAAATAPETPPCAINSAGVADG